MTLGAMVVSRESEDVVGEILRFVRQEGVRVLIVGRPSRKGLLGHFAPGIVARLLTEADGVDLFVVDVSRE